jgi:hypothetical protein
MTDVVHLHVGEPKTGTTYLQAMLVQHRAQLAADGLLHPGRRIDQVRGAQEMLERRDDGRGRLAGRWQALVDEITAFEGPAAVISMESLVRARPEQAARAVAALGVGDVRVVVTLRDLVRVVPAQWQESLQFGHTWTFADYLDSVTSRHPRTGKPGRSFWEQHDTTRILRVWSDVVGVQNVTVVTLPRRSTDPLALWRRFATALDIDAGRYEAVQTANESLGAASAELLRRVNLRLGDDAMSRPEYGRAMRDGLSKSILAARRESETRVVLPDAARPWAHRRSEKIVASIVQLGVRVVGDLDDLRSEAAPSAPPKGPAKAPSTPDETDVSAAAVDAIIALARARPR